MPPRAMLRANGMMQEARRGCERSPQQPFVGRDLACVACACWPSSRDKSLPNTAGRCADMTTETAAPASSLLRSFKRTDAALSLAASKIETEQHSTFQGANARLNPTRLLRRIAALEAELPKLKQAAAQNDAARRSILGSLCEALHSNQARTIALAGRAHACIDEDAAAFASAEAVVRNAVSRLPLPSAVEADTAAAPAVVFEARPPRPLRSTSPPPPPPPPLESATTDDAPSQQLPATAPLIGELQWLRLASAVREGVSRDDINQFWSLLRSLFVKRETRSLQAAQLLALGVRMSDENARKMRILQALGLIKLANNAVALCEDPA